MVFARKEIISYCLVMLLVALFLEACAGIRQADIGVKNEEAVRLVKEGARLYDREKYEEALKKFSEAEGQAALPEDKIKIADILFTGGFRLSEKKLFQPALLYYDRSSEINRTLNNKPGLINDYSYIGKTYTDIGKYEEGIR